MGRFENFKVNIKSRFDSDELNCSVEGRAQYYLTSDELDALGVDRRIVRDVKLAVTRTASIGTTLHHNIWARSAHKLDLYVVPTVATTNSFGGGAAVRHVGVKASVTEAMLRLLTVSDKMCEFQVNAILALTTLNEQIAKLLKMLDADIDAEFSNRGWVNIIDAVNVVNDANVDVDAVEQVIFEAINAAR